MTLTELKLAAKRLRKQGPSLFGAVATDLTQAQALEMTARLHGFRDYHEAQQRLSQRSLLEDLLHEPGGMLATQGIAFNLADNVLATRGLVHVEGQSGTGKTMLCNELVVQALTKGRPVRVLDMGGGYRHLTQVLGGEYFSGTPADAAYAAWAGSANLVTFDTDWSANVSALDFTRLNELPPDALVLCDEIGAFRAVYQPLEARTCVLVGQNPRDFMQESKYRLVFSRMLGTQLIWQWHTAEKNIELALRVGPLRMAGYSTRLEHVQARGENCDPERLEVLVQSFMQKFGASD